MIQVGLARTVTTRGSVVKNKIKPMRDVWVSVLVGFLLAILYGFMLGYTTLMISFAFKLNILNVP